MSRRRCESCTACCEGWLSSMRIEMSFGKPFRHCTADGCAIYPTRPEQPCRSFECEWIRQGGEAGDEIQWFQHHVGRAITKRLFVAVHDPALT